MALLAAVRPPLLPPAQALQADHWTSCHLALQAWARPAVATTPGAEARPLNAGPARNGNGWSPPVAVDEAPARRRAARGSQGARRPRARAVVDHRGCS